MKGNFTRAALLALLSLAGGAELMAQKFTNNAGGVYNASCNAVIRLKTQTVVPAGSYFDGGAALGTSTGNYIPGVVDYNASGAGQVVQAAYYSYLFLSGGAKSITDGVHIYGSTCATTMFAGYTNLSSTVPYYANSGARTYNGTFYYDAPTGTQNIFAEANATSGSNRYANLNLAGGTKTNDAAIIVEGGLTTTAGTVFNEGANVTLASNTTTSNIAGTINVGASSTLTVSGTAHVNVTGTLALANDATSQISLGAGTYLDVAGTFSNALGAKTNMAFDATSTVAYTSATAQTILGTSSAAASNKYGNLVFSGAGTKTANDGSANPNVYTKGTVAIAGGPIVMPGTTVFDVDVTGRGSSPISYASANNDQYIQGKVNLSGTIPTGIPLTMNNAQTQATFSTPPGCFQLDILPVTAPTNLNNFSLATDANRSITVTYCGNAGVLSNLRLGYTSADVVGPTFTGNESRFRMVEGYSNSAAGQKLTGNAGIATNNGAADARFVQLAGSIALNNPSNGGTVNQLGSGSNIVLTTVPNTFIAVNSGRWTNPNVWDEGSVPTSLDNTELRVLVYAGIAGPAFGTLAAGNTTPEYTHYGLPANGGNGNAPAANSILIPTGYPGASLVVGNEDNPNTYVFHTATSGSSAGVAAGFVNNNAGATALTAANDKTATPTVNGLYISTIVSAGKEAAFGTALITNTGTINNQGIIEIGE